MTSSTMARYFARRDRDAATLSRASLFTDVSHALLTWRQFFAVLRVVGRCYDGGYPASYLTSDGGVLCYDCARGNARLIAQAIRASDDCGGWLVIAVAPHYENERDTADGGELPLYCDNCAREIPAAYSDREVSQ